MCRNTSNNRRGHHMGYERYKFLLLSWLTILKDPGPQPHNQVMLDVMCLYMCLLHVFTLEVERVFGRPKIL
jgi:hypothetical protein